MILIGKIADKENKKAMASLSKISLCIWQILLPRFISCKKHITRRKRQLKQVEENGEKFSEATLKVLKIAFISAFMLEFIATISIAIIAVNIGLSSIIWTSFIFTSLFLFARSTANFINRFANLVQLFMRAMNGIVASSEILIN